MAKHSDDPDHNGDIAVEDYTERAEINDLITRLVDRAESEAAYGDTIYSSRHSTGALDRDSEKDALTDWFGIDV